MGESRGNGKTEAGRDFRGRLGLSGSCVENVGVLLADSYFFLGGLAGLWPLPTR